VRSVEIGIDGILGGKERRERERERERGRLVDRELSRQVFVEWSSTIVDGR